MVIDMDKDVATVVSEGKYSQVHIHRQAQDVGPTAGEPIRSHPRGQSSLRQAANGTLHLAAFGCLEAADSLHERQVNCYVHLAPILAEETAPDNANHSFQLPNVEPRCRTPVRIIVAGFRSPIPLGWRITARSQRRLPAPSEVPAARDPARSRTSASRCLSARGPTVVLVPAAQAARTR